MKVVSERLGHRTIRMTLDVHGHLLPGQDAEAATCFEQLITDTWDRRWTDAVRGRPAPF